MAENEDILRALGLGILSPDPSTEKSSDDSNENQGISPSGALERNDDSPLADNSGLSEEDNLKPSTTEKCIYSSDSTAEKKNRVVLGKEQFNPAFQKTKSQLSSKNKFICDPDVSTNKKNIEKPSNSVIFHHPSVSSDKNGNENPSRSIIDDYPGRSSHKKNPDLCSRQISRTHAYDTVIQNLESTSETGLEINPGPSSEKPNELFTGAGRSKTTQSKQSAKKHNLPKKPPEVLTITSSDESSIECIGEVKPKESTRPQRRATVIIQQNSPDNPGIQANAHEILEVPSSPEMLEVQRDSSESSAMQSHSSRSSKNLPFDLPGTSKMQIDMPGISKVQLDLPGPSKIQLDLPGPSNMQIDLPGSSNMQLDSQGTLTIQPELISLEDFQRVIRAVAQNLQRGTVELREAELERSPEMLRPTFEEFWETLATKNIKPIAQEDFDRLNQALDEEEARQKMLNPAKPSTSGDENDHLNRIKRWACIAYRDIPPEEFHEALRVDEDLRDLDYEEIYETLDELLNRMPPPSQSTHSAASSLKEATESSDDDINKTLASSKFKPKRRQILSSDSENSKQARDDSSSDGDMNEAIASSGKTRRRCEILSSDSSDSRVDLKSQMDANEATVFSNFRLTYLDEANVSQPETSDEDSNIRTGKGATSSSDTEESSATEISSVSKNITEEDYISSEHSNKSDSVSTTEIENSQSDSRLLDLELNVAKTKTRELSENSSDAACSSLSDYSGKLSESEESKLMQIEKVIPLELPLKGSNEKSDTEKSITSPYASEQSLDSTSKTPSELEESESSNASNSLSKPAFQPIHEDINPMCSAHSGFSKKESNDDENSKEGSTRSSASDEVLTKSFRRTSLSDRSPSGSGTESVYGSVKYDASPSVSAMQPVQEEVIYASSAESTIAYIESRDKSDLENATSDNSEKEESEKSSRSERNSEIEMQSELIVISSESSEDKCSVSPLKRTKTDEESSSSKDLTASELTEKLSGVLKSVISPKQSTAILKSEVSSESGVPHIIPGEYHLLTPEDLTSSPKSNIFSDVETTTSNSSEKEERERNFLKEKQPKNEVQKDHEVMSSEDSNLVVPLKDFLDEKSLERKKQQNNQEMPSESSEYSNLVAPVKDFSESPQGIEMQKEEGEISSECSDVSNSVAPVKDFSESPQEIEMQKEEGEISSECSDVSNLVAPGKDFSEKSLDSIVQKEEGEISSESSEVSNLVAPMKDFSQEKPLKSELQKEEGEISSESSEDSNLLAPLKRRKTDKENSSAKDTTVWEATDILQEAKRNPKDSINILKSKAPVIPSSELELFSPPKRYKRDEDQDSTADSKKELDTDLRKDKGSRDRKPSAGKKRLAAKK